MNDFEILIKYLDLCIKDTQNNAFVIGKTFLGQNIYAFHKGPINGKQMLISGGIHAREYISCLVVLKLLEDYDLPYGCYFVPTINLDGICLSICGLDFVKDDDIKYLLYRLNNNSTNFKLWKANARGVDLNTNFDAGFGESKFAKPLPCSSGFAGEYVNSEPETIALVNFVNTIKIDYSVAFHSKGKVVYYGFEGLDKNVLKKENKMASFFAKNLGYKKIRSIGSTGGLGDYLGLKHNVPSVTIELGDDRLKHPINLQYFDIIYKSQYKTLKKFMEKNFD